MEAENEVFDLCKQVYKATGWTGTNQVIGIYYQISEVDVKYGIFDRSEKRKEPVDTPLYTSDYLLEKLPSVVQDPYDKIFRHIQMWINGDRSAHAGYVEPYAHDDRVAYAQKSDEMRITLLKLTLKLHEEGLL